MESIRSLTPLKAGKKNSFKLVPCEYHAAYLVFTNHFRTAAIPNAKGKCDSKKQKTVQNTGDGQHACVCS